jgi:hypothetical protein
MNEEIMWRIVGPGPYAEEIYALKDGVLCNESLGYRVGGDKNKPYYFEDCERFFGSMGYTIIEMIIL